jgi:hypothetical protein
MGLAEIAVVASGSLRSVGQKIPIFESQESHMLAQRTLFSRSSLFGAALVLPLAVAVPALAAPTADAGPSAAAESAPPSVLVFDQAAKDGQVKISYAYLPKNGYVVVYGTTPDGKRTAAPLGSKSLPRGDHRDIAIKLDSTPGPGTKLWASIYEDRDGKPGPAKGTDVSIWNDKLPLENSFVVR